MTYKGHIRNRAVVLDDPVQLPDGAEVTVEIYAPTAAPLAGSNLCVDPWAALEKEIVSLQDKAESLLAQELLPPTPAARHRIAPLFANLRTQNLNPPFRAVPDGEGGIMLEWIDSARREIVRTIQVSAEGTVEMTEFTGNRLQSRHQIN